MLNVVKATFPSFEGDGPSVQCETLSDDVERLSCRWRGFHSSYRDNRLKDVHKRIDELHLVSLMGCITARIIDSSR